MNFLIVVFAAGGRGGGEEGVQCRNSCDVKTVEFDEASSYTSSVTENAEPPAHHREGT